MKKQIFVFITVLVYILSSALLKAQNANDFIDLARVKDNVKSKRVSSYDKTGGNGDCLGGFKDGEKRVIMDVKGAGIITHIWITIAPPEISRNDIILRIYWDGNTFPSVESPIGPFFGQGWDEAYDFVSYPLAAGPVNGKGLTSYFAMPFATGARIEIENQTGRSIDAFYFNIDYEQVDKLPAEMGRFCAWYNHELTEALPDGENEWGSLGKTGNNLDGKNNYVIMNTVGKGHYVGVNYYVHSPGPMWYGEGDEMVFIDGETLPSINGTGTEDYFNMSWCPQTEFKHLFYGFGRLNKESGWLGRTHLYRFHITDPIYFDKSLKFTIEHGHNNNLTLDMATVAYWYQQPPLLPLAAAPTKEDRKPKPFVTPYDMHKWRDAWRKSKGSGSKLWGNE